MSKKSIGLSNIDNELHEICKNIDISFDDIDSIEEGFLISDNAIMLGSIFPHRKYENREGYNNKDDGSFDKLLDMLENNE